MAFKCGKCKESHDLAAEGRACYAGDLFTCHWMIEIPTEDGLAIVDCGAWAIATDRGFSCRAGHSHVNAETAWREGWGYADGPYDAKSMMMAGVFPMKMDGSGPSEIAS